ncbi:DUF2158 domain-containing protein [Neorhizobium sp. BT27B]
MSKTPTEIVPGSVVEAKSGGPRMTVSTITGETAFVQ